MEEEDKVNKFKMREKFVEIGYKIRSELNLDLPTLLIFTSSFCSKCMANLNILRSYLSTEDITEINIAAQGAVLEEIKPNIVPTQMVVSKDKRIMIYSEGVISMALAKRISDLLNKLKHLDKSLE